jgi:putative multiple sugar transport system substrate-binding protein
MKRSLSILLAAILLLSVVLVGCTLPSVPGGTSGTGGATGKGELIGVAMPTKSLQRWNQDGEHMQKLLEQAGYKVDLQYAEDDVELQVSQIENMITKGAKVLVIASIDGESMGGVCEQAAKEGIKVIAYDRLIKGTPYVDYYATFDNYKVGAIQGKYIVETLKLDKGEKGPFTLEVFGGSPDDNNAYFFNQGAMDILNPYIKSGVLVVKSGQVEMEKIAIPAWKSATAQARMDNLLTAFYADENVDVILSPNDSIATGIVASLKAAGYGTASKPYPILTGQDCDIANVKHLIAGEQSMSVFKDTRTLAGKVVGMVDAILKGTEPEINDTETYDNGVKIVPSYLCEPVFADVNNYKELLIDSGYYTEDQLK